MDPAPSASPAPSPTPATPAAHTDNVLPGAVQVDFPEREESKTQDKQTLLADATASDYRPSEAAGGVAAVAAAEAEAKEAEASPTREPTIHPDASPPPVSTLPSDSPAAALPSFVTPARNESQDQHDHVNPTVAEALGLESPDPSAKASEPAAGADAGTTHLSLAFMRKVAARFQPLVWLDEDETYLPASVPLYLAGAKLSYDPEGNKNTATYIELCAAPKDEQLTDEGLYALLDAHRSGAGKDDARIRDVTLATLDFKRFHLSVATDEAKKGVGAWPEVNRVPFYARVRAYADRLEITYVLSFSFNAAHKVCCSFIGAHSVDLEHITVRTSLAGDRLDWIFFGAHGSADGVWRQAHEIEVLAAPPGDIEAKGTLTRPVVYSSAGSHAMYPSPGVWCRICGCANDETSGPASTADGRYNAWDPVATQTAPVLVYATNDSKYLSPGGAAGLGFLRYRGTMAEDGVDAMQMQPWFTAETSYSNNTCRRCLWPCRYLECGNECCYNCCQSQVDFSKQRHKDPEQPPAPGEPMTR